MSENDPQAPAEPESEAMSARNARYGTMLFVVYCVLYGSFMALNVYDPKIMARTPLAGVNLAILYGFGLIVAALALAGLYMWLVRSKAGEGGR
ncbi:MAG: DUF485 domain-containing protein [Planctomycetes bacterium]|nr:DUF485 domain-containing protein [Planctomycetota bacterium]